ARLGVAMLASFAGVWAVAEPSFGASRLVIAVCLFSALCSALARIWLRRMGPNESSEAIVFHFMAVATVVLGLMSIPCWKTPDLESTAFLVLTGVTGGLAQLAMTRAYALDQAPRVSAVGYAGVVFTRLFAAPVFDEIPSPLQIAGSLLVIGSGVSMALGGTRAARTEN